MSVSYLHFEFLLLIYIYFIYFGNVIFIKYELVKYFLLLVSFICLEYYGYTENKENCTQTCVSNYEFSSNKLQYDNITAELQERFPGYRIQKGYYKPPDVKYLYAILALQFFFKGLFNLTWKLILMPKKYRIHLILFVAILISMEDDSDFGIFYESHTLFSMQDPEMEIPNVDQLENIIRKKGITFPRAIAVAALFELLSLLSRSRL